MLISDLFIDDNEGEAILCELAIVFSYNAKKIVTG